VITTGQSPAPLIDESGARLVAPAFSLLLLETCFAEHTAVLRHRKLNDRYAESSSSRLNGGSWPDRDGWLVRLISTRRRRMVRPLAVTETEKRRHSTRPELVPPGQAAGTGLIQPTPTIEQRSARRRCNGATDACSSCGRKAAEVVAGYEAARIPAVPTRAPPVDGAAFLAAELARLAGLSRPNLPL